MRGSLRGFVGLPVLLALTVCAAQVAPLRQARRGRERDADRPEAAGRLVQRPALPVASKFLSEVVAFVKG